MHPTKKATEITNNTSYCPIWSIPIELKISWGICAKDNIQANPAPAPTRIKTTAVTNPVDFAVSKKSLSFIVLYTTPSKNTA